ESFSVSYRSAGENIAAGQATPEEVVKAWMNSEGHRKNILNPGYTEIGVGYISGGSYGHYWTQMFISK
ncbi:CAP domain-containing protein, partial [Micrococcus sp. SIMBA_131]